MIVAIGTLQHPTTYSPYNTLNLEKENVTIDFSSQDNFCPDTTTQKVDSVTRSSILIVVVDVVVVVDVTG